MINTNTCTLIRHYTGCFLLLCMLCLSAESSAQSNNVLYPDLRKMLVIMAEIDVEVRAELMGKGFGNVDSLDIIRQQAIDEAHTKILDKIIQNYGWPTREMVGQEGVDAAFLIVQHSDDAFQKRMVPMIEASFERGDVSAHDYALLVDRVLLYDGKPQRYGTQAEITNGVLVVLPIEDKQNLEKRRASLGLLPMEDYVREMEKLYGMKVKGW